MAQPRKSRDIKAKARNKWGALGGIGTGGALNLLKKDNQSYRQDLKEQQDQAKRKSGAISTSGALLNTL